MPTSLRMAPAIAATVRLLEALVVVLSKSVPEVGTSTFRPNYTPVTFGAFAGRDLDVHHEPVRKTCLHAWHAEHGAPFEDVGVEVNNLC